MINMLIYSEKHCYYFNIFDIIIIFLQVLSVITTNFYSCLFKSEIFYVFLIAILKMGNGKSAIPLSTFLDIFYF